MKFGQMVRAMDAQDILPRAAALLGMERASVEHALIHGEFVPKALARLPQRWAQPVLTTYKETFKGKGRKAAHVAVLDVLESVGKFRFGVASNEDDLRQFAKARAEECFRAAARWKDADAALEAMQAIALRCGIMPPDGRNVTKQGKRARLLDELWWRRQARKVAGRNVEGAAIGVGLVHRRAGLYASDETVARRAGQKRRNRALLESITAVNDEGQEYTLAALSDLGVSNPEKRRLELMTRLAGFDALAVAAGHASEFYTLTAPSKFHARESVSGKENRSYSGVHPRETQAYLCNVWAKARAALHRLNISVYGFRVCEPHHDGTPHWHMVLFMKPEHVETVRDVLKRYALQEDGKEKGAALHRFKAEAIDRSKGSAVGYLAKYIAKNIDGYGVGEDWEAVEGQDDAATSAQRVDAWASCWGIRQFQQIGGQSVTVWRELRRLDAEGVEDVYLRAIVEAADAGNWMHYTNLMGGALAEVSKKTGRLAMHREVRPFYLGAVDVETGEISLNKYGEVAGSELKGIVCGADLIETRVREWVFKRGGAAVTPWSSVNNCTGDFKNVGSEGEIGSGGTAVRGVASVPDDRRKGGSIRAGTAGDVVGADGKVGIEEEVIPTWGALPAYMQRVRAGLFFDGKGMAWQR